MKKFNYRKMMQEWADELWWPLLVGFIILLVVIMLGMSGCDETLRFAPSEPLKQNAELTYELAGRVNREGTFPGSQASERLLKGTRATLTYMGRPVDPVDVDEFEVVNDQAGIDAEKRPDVGKAVDSTLALGIGICTLLGGGVGLKGVQLLNTVRSKAQGFEELVKANELFKQNADGKVNGEFKAANDKVQSLETRKLVAQVRAS